MYNSFGCTVVERGVVPIITMIIIEIKYWSWVSIGFIVIKKLIAEEPVFKPPCEEFSLDAKPLLAYYMLTQHV